MASRLTRDPHGAQMTLSWGWTTRDWPASAAIPGYETPIHRLCQKGNPRLICGAVTQVGWICR